jgi:hypothetical protein
LEARRRAFLWTGEKKCHGSQCLIAWERVCQSKENGGLGIRQLADQNHALLLKFVHKLYEPDVVPWKNWFLSQHHGTLGDLDPESFIARLLPEELPRYRNITMSRLGNGKTTDFLAR